MKKVLLLLMAMLSAQLFADESETRQTAGTLSVSQTVSLNPDGTVDEDSSFITIAFDDKEPVFYTAFQFDVVLPDGISLGVPDGWDIGADINTDNGVYKKSGRNYAHSCASNMIGANTIRILVTDGTYQNTALLKHSGNLVDIYLKASAYTKPGDFEISIKNIKFVTPEEVGYVYEDQLNLAAGTVSADASLNIRVTKANKVGTLILPFASQLPEGLTAYTCTGIDGDYLTLAEISAFEAYKPYLIYNANGFEGTLTGTLSAADYPEGSAVSDTYLTGVLKTTEVSAGYILQNQDGSAKFYIIGSTPFSLPAGRCYLNLLTASSSRPAYIPGINTTDINAVETSAASVGAIYDLQGREVSNPQSGNIYVIDGKQVLKR